MTIILICLTAAGLMLSLIKSRKRTGKALRFSLKMGKSMVFELLTILIWIALILSFLSEERIARFLGEAQGMLAPVYGAVIGSITILPGVIAFPLARKLYESGAALTAVAAFITTLTMVGLATSPLEKKSFGLKYTLLRNSFSFLFALLIALVMGAVL